MAITINYTKTQYEAKITTLEGLQAQLRTHLDRMESLRSRMFEFWNDPKARSLGTTLSVEITSVRNAMDTTAQLLTLYRSIVTELDGSGEIVDDLLAQAASIATGGLSELI